MRVCENCSTLLEGKQERFCSDKCRKQVKRAEKAYKDGSGSTNPDTPTLDSPDKPGQMSDLDIPDKPTRTRTEGCRVAIPGDEDYSGICKQIDGRWIADKTDPPAVKDLPRAELYQAIRSYPHDQWINSPEHKELLRRLHTMSIDELETEGYWTPAGKISA